VNARRIVALPVDARPVVREQVCTLMRAAGWDLEMPSVPMLGFLREPADRDANVEWLERESRSAAGIIVSIDMLVYGGLVPSRLITDSLEALLPRLDILRGLKSANPGRPVYAFASTMRISNNNVAEEEKDYWATHGEAIWKWSFAQDRAQTSLLQTDIDAARDAESRVPQPIREDYLATRARNRAVTARVLDFVEAGIVDRLILPQDDTAQYGFNIAERRHWQDDIARRQLGDRVFIYPGADEVLHTLGAFMASRLDPHPAVRVALIYDDPDGARTMTARYEDRPLLETLRGQADASGIELVEEPVAADIVALVHTRGAVQGDHAMGIPAASVRHNLDAMTRVAAFADAGKHVAILDCAYANGGDVPFVEAMHHLLPMNRWFGYAAWNTAGNRIGNLFAHCALAARGAENTEFTAMRVLEDALYQGQYRRTIRTYIDEAAMDPAALENAVRETFVGPANAWAQDHGLAWRIKDIDLPWNRTFEIGLTLERTA
jgi:hypothetical protein